MDHREMVFKEVLLFLFSKSTSIWEHSIQTKVWKTLKCIFHFIHSWWLPGTWDQAATVSSGQPSMPPGKGWVPHCTLISWARGLSCTQASLAVHRALSSLGNQTRLHRRFTNPGATAQPMHLTKGRLHSSRVVVVGQREKLIVESGRHSNLEWLRDDYTATLLLPHNGAPFTQQKTQFSNNRLSIAK